MPYYAEGKDCTFSKVERALGLILEALADETSDRKFYKYLMQIAPDQEQQNIIKLIRDDEIKHFKMFRMIYQEITCQLPIVKQTEECTESTCYCAAIEQAIFGELKAVELYRKIMFGMCYQRHRDMLFEIITDELKHSVKWNFLYSKNCSGCCKE